MPASPPPLRVVIVGCGSVLHMWFATPAMRELVNVVGLVDRDPAASARAITDHALDPDTPTDTDAAALLARVRPTAVFVCTPPGAHRPAVATALAAGCHVLCEKPMADDLADARAMCAAAEQAGRTLAVIQNRRFQPAIRRLQRFLASGAIGRVHDVHADFFIAANFGGFRAAMDHVLLGDMAIHSFDQARMLAGGRARSVWCESWNPPDSCYRHGANALACFRMHDETVITYRGSWTATGAETSWECAWRILGTRGAVTWDGGDGFQAEVLSEPLAPSRHDGGPLIRQREAVAVPPLDTEPAHVGHGGVIADFVHALAAGTDPETVGHDNLHSVAMLHGAIASAERGQRYHFSEDPPVR